MDWLQKETNLWEHLKETSKPIVIYGMGDGADKLLRICEKKGICVSGIYCSDEFVRNKQFHGFTVGNRKKIEEKFSDFIVLVAFGTHLPQVMDKIKKTEEDYETYLPDLPLYGHKLFDRKFVETYQKELEQTETFWADGFSRALYREILLYKWTGKSGYLERTQPRTQGYREIFELGKNEIYVDAGAYRGESVEEFIQMVGHYQKIIAIEPDQKTFRKLEQRCCGMREVICCQAAAYKEDTMLRLRQKAGRNSSIGKAGTPVAGRKIDTILNGEEATIIKYDVEGGEQEALEGSFETIKKWRPNLLISLYHKNTDLFRLPMWIHQMDLGYELYLRREPCFPAWEIMLYAKRGGKK